MVAVILGRMENEGEKSGEKMIFLVVWLRVEKMRDFGGVHKFSFLPLQNTISPNWSENWSEMWKKYLDKTVPTSFNVFGFFFFFWLFLFVLTLAFFPSFFFLLLFFFSFFGFVRTWWVLLLFLFFSFYFLFFLFYYFFKKTLLNDFLCYFLKCPLSSIHNFFL